jgi:hypothetical protein
MSTRCNACRNYVQNALDLGFTDSINIDQHGTLKMPETGNGRMISTTGNEHIHTCIDCCVSIYLISTNGVNGILIDFWDILQT